MPVFIIDTEGLDAIDEEHNHDSKIFLLSILLCSLFIYNSVGTIDENALNSLSLAINLSTQLEDLDEYFPSFLWILRDFSLKLEDEKGNDISAKMYLDSALREQKGSSDNIESKNRVRRMIKHFFRERDLSVLVRPTEEEEDLQNLWKLTNNELRTEFVGQLKQLKAKIYKRVGAKKLNNQFITGPMLWELAQSYTKSLNDGCLPRIESAWDYMCNEEVQRGLKQALQNVDDQINSIEADLPIDEDDLVSYKNTIFKNAIEVFHNSWSILDDTQGKEYINKIAVKIDEDYVYLVRHNKDKLKETIEKWFQNNCKQTINK